jgi:uncharacterized membrane protein
VTLYEFLLFVHVAAAVVWVGGATMHLALMLLARRTGADEDHVKLVDWDERLGVVFYLPSSLLVLAAGIGLVLEGNWDWDQAWIVLGLVIFGLTFVIGVAFYIPQGKKLQAAIQAGGHGSTEAVARASTIASMIWIDLALLMAAVFVMTTKPGL